MDEASKGRHHVKDKHAQEHQRQVSKVQEKNINPVWNESMLLPGSWPALDVVTMHSPGPHGRLSLFLPHRSPSVSAFEFELDKPELSLISIDLWDHDESISVGSALNSVTKVCPKLALPTMQTR